MADVLPSNTAYVRPLNGAHLEPEQAGGNLTIGNGVSRAADGDMVATDANAAATSEFEGIVVAVPSKAGAAKVTAVDGEAITICNRGRVSGFDTSSQTPGDQLWVSETAGALTDVAPAGAGTTWVKLVGRVITSDAVNGVIELDPEITPATAN